MKTILSTAAALACAVGVWAGSQLPCRSAEWEDEATDTTDMGCLQQVEVVAGRATRNTPMAVSDVPREAIAKQNHGRDLPSVLELLPAVTTTSDAGAGIGYTSLRIRGIDPSRINVTVNGIPLNDAESLQPFWVNTGDLASSLNDIQVQRGAGCSTNGAGAFGASLNMTTARAAMQPCVSFDGTYGSWNTHKETLRMGTGLLRGHWTFDARLSNIASDGFIDRAATHLQSFFTQTGFFSGQTSVKLLVFGGREKTYHAWNYATAEEIAAHGRRYNSCGEYHDEQGRVHYYPNQDDIYTQLHTQLHLTHTFGRRWRTSAALHCTRGYGYYEEYKEQRTLQEYGLLPWHNADGGMEAKSDLVRRKQMDNWFAGETLGAEYNGGRLHLTMGQAFNHYRGHHFGNIIWVRNYTDALMPDHEYYRNRADKSDFNVYAKGDLDLGCGLSAYADVQYRHVNYRMAGRNDNWDWRNSRMQNLAVADNFHFVNPKAGLNWQIGPRHRLYTSYAYVGKEPYRNCYTDGRLDTDGSIANYPRPEYMHDLEAGYQYTAARLSVAANVYYMHYRDQLVLTGELNDIGEPLTANADRSYRFGIEAQAAYKPCRWLRWDVNATWSRNRIRNFVEYVYDGDTGLLAQANRRGDTRISMSPDWIVGSQLTFSAAGFEAAFSTKFVSRQYMTNAQVEAHALDAYCTSNLQLSYSWQPKRVLKSVAVGLDINNLFNHQYESNGYAGAAIYNGVRCDYAGYSVQAGANVLGHVSLNF